MEKLELKHIVGYLPYGLPARLSKEGVFNLYSEYPNEHKYKIGYINNFNWYNGVFAGELKISKTYSFDFDSAGEIEIVLRPLTDLTKEIKVNGEKFVPINWFDENIFPKHNSPAVCFTDGYVEMCYFKEYEKLYEWHFDIHGLIEKGLAIDINTIDNGIQ